MLPLVLHHLLFPFILFFKDQLLKGACRRLVATRCYHNCWIALFDEKGRLDTAVESGVGEKFTELLEIFRRGDLVANIRKALKRPGVAFSENPSKTCADCPLADQYSGRSGLCVRLGYADRIFGVLVVALIDLQENSPVYHSIEQMRKAGQRAAALTRQLLAFSRKQTIQPEILNLNEILMESEKMLRRLIGEDIDFLTVYEQEPWHVYVDPGQVDQVVMNLVVNARDAMPKGGKLTIETANMELGEGYFRERGVESAPGQYVMVAVTDTGVGMDQETRSRIFEPFFTTKELGRGTGLGLSTVFGIVKQNNGLIWVYSEPGKGTTFKIYLPRSEKQGETSGQEELPLSQIRGTETILLVEDDRALRDLAKEMLEGYGYTVLLAQNGDEALKLANNHQGRIHLLLTDVVMPGMDGRELAEKLQSKRPNMKVLFMSGYTDNAIAHHEILDTGLSFIQKPFTAASLTRKIRGTLG